MKNKSVNSLSRRLLIPIFAASLVGCGGADTQTETKIVEIDTQQPVSGWEMVWSDEFDGDALDMNNWNIEVNCDGGGNFEQQCYTDSPDNLFVADGMLNIVALPAEEGAALPYTSARINSSNKADFRYGRIEVRAQMPEGQGSWPAIWMLPTDYVYGGWPKSGEIDIVEAVNQNTVGEDGVPFSTVYATLHYGEDFPRNLFSGRPWQTPEGQAPADGFNTYAIEWQEGEIRWYYNDYLYAMQRESDVRVNARGEAIGLRHKGWFVPQFNPVTGEEEFIYNEAPFDEFFHLILNFAVGGSLPENTNLGGIDPTVYENGQSMVVDWVRVFECTQDRQTGRGCETLRQGYEVPYNPENGATDEGPFVEGEAPSPSPPAPDVANPITIFADSLAEGWELWDCCGGTEPEVVMDEDPAFGSVAEFEILDNAGTVLGFFSRNGGEPFNASAMLTNGSLSFDMKVVAAPAAETTWLLKVEADGNTSFAEVPLSTSVEGQEPVEGQWQRYTFPLQQLSDAGLDISQIDVILMFPAWQTGAGAVYRIDNLRIAPDQAPAAPELVLIDDEVNAGWTLWDCCGGTSPQTVEVEAPYGTVAEFEILDNAGTVLGFNGRENGNTFDATDLLANGIFQFDMRVVAAPSAETTWLLKIEADGNTSFAEVPLNTSQEGADPVEGQWQTYTFDMLALADAGLDVSAIDIIMVFPAWQTGAGAVYQIDNARFYDPDASAGGAPAGPLLQVFTDSINPEWTPWDCCGGTTPTVEMDDAEYGATTEFRILDNAGTVLGYNGRENGVVFDATDVLSTGVLRFDMKVVAAPSAETTWLLKVEADGNTSFAEVPLNTSQEGQDPVEGQWQSYTFDLLSLSDAGLDVSAIDIIMVFPAWQTGAGAVYRIDNVFVGNPSDINNAGSGGGGTSGGDAGMDNVATTIFADQVNEAWPLWDCCAGSTPTVEMDDAEHGATAEFSILGNPQTVLGFNGRDVGTAYDADTYASTGKLQFEFKLMTAPTNGDTDWFVKVEAENGPLTAAEINLADSIEGTTPIVGEWQTYTFDLSAMADQGLDLSAIDIVMVFPLWDTGLGAVYRVDNVVFLEE